MPASNLTSEPVAVNQTSQQLQVPENFTVIALPDTQFYSQSYPAIFDNQTEWIVNNVEDMNTKFVTHEGDIVNNPGSSQQWQRANHSLSSLDGYVPWAVLPGNHDGTSVGTPSENLVNYNTYFHFSRFNEESWYGGAYNNVNTNSYELFQGGFDDYLIFHFQYHPNDAILSWANAVIANHPNRRVIVTTHDYLDLNGLRREEGNHIWNKFVAPHSNQIFLVLCGHMHGEARRTDTVNGYTVYQLLADYQAYPNGGNGWLRTLDFRPVEDKIHVKTYSPYIDDYQTDSDSQFTLDYDMTSEQPHVSEAIHLLLTVHPNCAAYAKDQTLTLIVTIFNDNDSTSASSLTLTVTGPEEYSFHDTQPVNVSAGKFIEYSFTWTTPDAAGTYLVEVELAPAQLTAYDSLWLEVG